jgi:hypothetical protein
MKGRTKTLSVTSVVRVPLFAGHAGAEVDLDRLAEN